MDARDDAFRGSCRFLGDDHAAFPTPDLAARLRDHEAVDELETHLRDLFEAALATGLSPEAAWRTAIAKTGDVKSLEREFAKLRGDTRYHRMLTRLQK